MLLDRIAQVWQRGSAVVIAPPVPIRRFIDALQARCPSASNTSIGWAVAPADADTAVALLYDHFPVVQDSRVPAPPPPSFVDGHADDPFARGDLVPLLAPLAPALRAIGDNRHDARAALAQVAAYDPDVPACLGFADSLEGGWVTSYVAQRFWYALLTDAGQVACGAVQPDGTLREWITAGAITAFWHRTRLAICGQVPEQRGQCWYPPAHTLPIWVAGLLACLDGPAFALDAASHALVRQLPPWPMRLRSELHRLDLKDAAHWPISICVLPGRQSRDGSDALLHLSSVNGVSKNRALWAAVLDGRREPIPVRTGAQRHYPRRVEGRRQYVADWNDEPLPASGLSHLALTHRSAFEPEPGHAFVHLAGNDLSGAPDLPLFAQQLSRAISVPFDLSWAEQLWAYGLEPGDSAIPLITPLPSVGCQGYWVLADEPRWTRLIVAVQQGVNPGSLRDDDLVVTEVGAPPRIDAVLEQAGEGGDDDDESDE